MRILVPVAFGSIVTESLHPRPKEVGWAVVCWIRLDTDIIEPRCRGRHNLRHHVQGEIEVRSGGSPRIHLIDMCSLDSHNWLRRESGLLFQYGIKNCSIAGESWITRRTGGLIL